MCLDWDQILLSAWLWSAFVVYHLILYEFVGAWSIAPILCNSTALLTNCFLILLNYIPENNNLAIVRKSFYAAELLADVWGFTLVVLNKKLPPRTALEVVVATV